MQLGDTGVALSSRKAEKDMNTARRPPMFMSHASLGLVSRQKKGLRCIDVKPYRDKIHVSGWAN